MKYNAYDIRNPNKTEKLEVYKLQTSLFSTAGSTVLIYNEDRTQMWEETKPNNVKALQEFMGKHIAKCYACGYQNEKGQIVLVDKVPEKEYWF